MSVATIIMPKELPLLRTDGPANPGNGLNQASEHSIQVSDAFQFPGKALLQADQARKYQHSAYTGH